MKDLHKRNPWGETLLHRACKRADLRSVRVLIQAGISVNMQDHAGWTALHEAAAQASKASEAMVEELLKAGANPSARSCDGATPLHDAVTSGNYQVVKLLLQSGSNTCDRTVGGVSAWDLAKDEEMKELLLTFRDSLVSLEKPHEEPEQHKHPGCKSSEAQCHKQLCSQRNFSPNIGSRESGDRAGIRGLAGVQLREKHGTALNLSRSESLIVVMEQIWRKQTELSTRLLSAPQEAGGAAAHESALLLQTHITERFCAARTQIKNQLTQIQNQLTQIQNQLSELLNKQTMERDRLARKQRTGSQSLWRHVLKTGLVSLASRQRRLVEILQNQKVLVEVFEKKRAQRHHGARGRPRVKPAPKSDVSRAQDRAAHRETRVSSRPPALCQSEDSSRSLSELMQGGLVRPGCALHVFHKSHLQWAHVLADGSLKDLKGGVHSSPERWLESVLAKRVPVSSAYAWDKVMLRGEPLSSYTLNQVCTDSASAREDLTSEEAGLKRLTKVRTVRLVEDEEFLPSAVMDSLWVKLLEDECSDPQWTGF